MKLTEIKVPFKSEEELIIIKGIVQEFMPNAVTCRANWFEGCESIVFDENRLLVTVYTTDCTEITLRQLIELLMEGCKEAEKISVKVEDEQQFKALMKYYDSLGWNPFSNATIKLFRFGEAVDFHDNYRSTGTDIQRNEGYKIIPFSDFAKQHNIRVPIITSEDGVELFEGDDYYRVVNSSTHKDWAYNGLCVNLKADQFVMTRPDKYKAFHSKEKALAWIEEQNKPKEVEIRIIGSTTTVKVTKYSVSNLDNLIVMNKSDIQKILKTMEELSND